MEFTTRTVRSATGLTQEEALTSLQSHPNYRAGSKVASIRRRGDRWVADILEPKTAGPFPPSGGGDEESGPPSDEAPSDDAPEKDEGGDEESSPDEGGGDDPLGLGGDEGGDEEGAKPDAETQILHTLQQILHALQGGPPTGGMGGPDELGPGAAGPGGPPPHAGPGRPPGPPGAGAGAGPAPHAGRPMRPGEAPPGSTPVGAPAFASLQAKVAAVAGKKRSFKITAPPHMSNISQVVSAVNAAANPHGYKVEQVRRIDGQLAALVVQS